MAVPRGRRRPTTIKTASRTSWRWIVDLVAHPLKHQTLAGNFAMRLRWLFHRNMPAQSLSFYQDEFAGRVATKVMQTALAVRDVSSLFEQVRPTRSATPRQRW